MVRISGIVSQPNFGLAQNPISQQVKQVENTKDYTDSKLATECRRVTASHYAANKLNSIKAFTGGTKPPAASPPR
jgi:hypothetical protein